jgi:dipeptidyl aminopeptidase/acylaminoacyl peptidase
MKKIAAVLAVGAMMAVSTTAPLAAQKPFDFSIRNIMRGPELYGRAPTNVRWTADGKWIYFSWLEPGTDYRENLKPFRVRAVAGAKPERVTAAHMDTVGPLLARGQRSSDGRTSLLEYRGDIYINDLVAGTTRALTQTLGRESSPQFSADGSEILFVREGNVFALRTSTGAIRQLTDLRAAAAPVDSAPPAGQRGRLVQQQRDLFEVVRDRVRADSISDADRKAATELSLKTIYLGRNQQVRGISIAPTGKALLVSTSVQGGQPRIAEVPRFVTESGYVENTRTFELVGDAQPTDRMAFVSLPSGDIKWLKLFPADTLNGNVGGAVWNRAGTRALFMSYSSNNKDMVLQSVSADGTTSTVEAVHDSAWVGGPCNGCFGWFDNDRRVWFVSEHDGYAHLYSANPDGSDRKQLTSGKWEVLSVTLSNDGRSFYMRTNEMSPAEEQFYRMPVSGGERQKLTTESGRHIITLSPDERLGADVYSFVNRPPDLFLNRLVPGAEATRLTTSPSAEFLSFNWVKPEIVMIPASDGVQVPAHIYRPADMGAQPNGAAVIFVHGAGYLHNVGNFWSEYPREYMFNQFLAAHGYVVLDVDYRASSGYGRDWRTAIYRYMGGRDLQDQVDASRYLEKNFNINPERVGVYGGSYGGFITLMALFTEPKYFGAGAALRSVTDWSHYNHGYTSNILNFPQTDTLAYHRSSPIYYAEGLEDPLLMLHGMVDTNVPFQDIVRLTQRLIELGKKNWDLAVYPVEDHGFVRPSSWTDEYGRIFDLFERWLSNPAKPGR